MIGPCDKFQKERGKENNNDKQKRGKKKKKIGACNKF